jgi:CRISPR/Cas system-associated endonuclease Cas1
MATLYLTEPRTTLRRYGEALAVTREGGGDAPVREVLLTLPPHQIEMIGLLGDVHVTADATRLCLKEGIGVAWFTPGGLLQGRLTPPNCRCADLRLRQYAAWHDPATRLRRARVVIAAKLRGGAAVLRRLGEGQEKDYLPLGRLGLMVMSYLGRVSDRSKRALMVAISFVGTRTFVL